ncbi:hypothetical protein H2248_004210 [Termitomyces sp. 'cryptogamus']|nr:hypothetical protein H2248_004210 [Termitomyces sp. 'cryptogamus']
MAGELSVPKILASFLFLIPADTTRELLIDRPPDVLSQIPLSGTLTSGRVSYQTKPRPSSTQIIRSKRLESTAIFNPTFLFVHLLLSRNVWEIERDLTVFSFNQSGEALYNSALRTTLAKVATCRRMIRDDRRIMLGVYGFRSIAVVDFREM